MSGFALPDVAALGRSRVLVLGLGRSGSSAARFLLHSGAAVAGYDASPAVMASGAVRKLRQAGMRVARDPATARADWAVVSPGIADDSAAVRALRRRHLPLVDELDLAARFVTGPVVGVTGTNGKSTTTALIAAMLERQGLRVFCGGNLAPGRPFSAALNRPRQDAYVVEASSFQLERARWFKPRVAVILNITPDHLNRHQSLARYAECKFRILDRQDEDDFAVLNRDDALVRQAQTRGRARRVFFSVKGPVRGAYLKAGALWFEGERVMAAGRVRLPGRHNLANGLAATAAARSLGATSAAVRAVLESFRGLPHRLELVRTLGGVDYINNSMCTNPAAGARSLEATAAAGKRRGVVLIAGGREKGLPIDEYAAAIARHAKWAVLLGESRGKLARMLDGRRFARHEPALDLHAAVAAARAHARRGDAVLFSPGFASFDQFADFQARGEAFRREVKRLA